LTAGHFSAFTNGIGNLAGLSQANAHSPALISNNHQGTEIEAPAAFNNLGGTVNKDHLFD
jgi:hypothetical protein